MDPLGWGEFRKKLNVLRRCRTPGFRGKYAGGLFAFLGTLLNEGKRVLSFGRREVIVQARRVRDEADLHYCRAESFRCVGGDFEGGFPHWDTSPRDSGTKDSKGRQTQGGE